MAAVSQGGSPSINSGSRNVIHGAVPGPKIPFFSPVAKSTRTDTFAASAPDPAVVGMVTIGAPARSIVRSPVMRS